MLCHLFFSEKRGKSKGLGEEKGQKESIETSSNPFLVKNQCLLVFVLIMRNQLFGASSDLF